MKRGTAIALAMTGAVVIGGGITAAVVMSKNKPAGKKNDKIEIPKVDPKNDPIQDPDAGLVTFGSGIKGRLVEINVEKGAMAPFIVALHGRDSDEAQLAEIASVIPARILLLRGAKKGQTGYRFFDAFFTDNNAKLAADIETATDAVTAAILEVENQLQSRGVYVGTAVVGYDQGGAIAYLLAAREIGGELKSSYLGIAGMLPPSLYPTTDDPKRWENVAVSGVNGTIDPKVPIKDAAATIDAFATKGPPTPFTAFLSVEGADHSLASLSAAAKAVILD